MRPSEIKRELRPMLGLAMPVALGELGWMMMGVVDLMMVGRLGAAAIGGSSVGRALFFAVAVFGIGLLLGLDTLVSQAYGAGRRTDGQGSLIQGLYIALGVTVPVTLIVLAGIPLLPRFGIDPEVLVPAREYASAVVWSALPLFVATALRRYLQAVNCVRPVMVGLISANVVNTLANWLLIFGGLGIAPLGVAGAGWATCIASLYLVVFFWLSIVALERRGRDRLSRVPLAPDPVRIRQLLALGFPAALHITLEFGAFALATGLAARLDPEQLAAHQIALTLASVTFMVPMGISSAAAVRVGHAIGRADPAGAAAAGWTALLIGGCFMSLAAIGFLSFPRLLIRAFTEDLTVTMIGVTLLAWAAAFQLFDGIQVVATGALRGAGDTHRPMLWNLVGHWLIGLPFGAYLCFGRGLGVVGLWVGFTLGLVFVGLVLIRVWSRRVTGGVLRAA